MKRETLTLMELAGLALLGYFAVQWWRDRNAGTAPPAIAPPPGPTTPATLPTTPAKVPWPDADLAPARARAQGFRPLANATAAQGAKARALLSQWDARSAWPDPSDPSILYVCAMHGAKRGVEVWQRQGAAPAAKRPAAADQLQLLANMARGMTDPAQLRAVAATAAVLGPRGTALAAEIAAKADAIERARAAQPGA